MNNPIPQCATDSPEWAFRAAGMINDLQRSVKDGLEKHFVERIEEVERQLAELREALEELRNEGKP